MTPPDRLVGALCLVVAVVAVTWGRSPAEQGQATTGDPGTVEMSAGETDRAVSDDPLTSTTAPAPATTATTAAASGPSTTTAPPAAATAAAPPSKEADEALAKRAVLGPADLPGGFVVVRPAPTGPGETDGPFERCLGADAATLTAAVRAKSRSAEFGRSGSGTVSSSSAVMDSPTSAEKVLATLATPGARTCFESLINTRLARNPNFSEDVRGTLAPFDGAGYGDQSNGFRFEVQLPAEDVEHDPGEEPEEKVPYIADFVFLRKGRVLALLEFGNLRQAFPAADLKAVATNLARRAE